MTNNRYKPPEGHDGVAEHPAHANKPLDRRNPPIATRFQPGQSGNPAGRPKGAKGRRKAVRDVLLEKREVRETKSAPSKPRTTLELLFMVLREKAFKGDRRAIKTLQDLTLITIGTRSPRRKVSVSWLCPSLWQRWKNGKRCTRRKIGH